MTCVLLQVDDLTPVQRAVREQFQQGGSALVALLTVAGIAALALIAYWLSQRLNSNKGARARPHDPGKLYRTLLDKLDLAPGQRQTLEALAADLRLRNPAALLLSPALFERRVARWSVARRHVGTRTGDDPSAHLVSRLRAVLFRPAEPTYMTARDVATPSSPLDRG